jgi:hypothetical protein
MSIVLRASGVLKLVKYVSRNTNLVREIDGILVGALGWFLMRMAGRWRRRWSL